jgi:hypothetical protein
MKRVLALMAAAAFVVVVGASPVLAAEHAAVGAEKCAKMCHKVEFESWMKTKHATNDPKVDCDCCPFPSVLRWTVRGRSVIQALSIQQMSSYAYFDQPVFKFLSKQVLIGSPGSISPFTS